MSVASTTNRVSFVGNGATTAFAFPYYCFAAADLKVVEVDLTTGVETAKALTTDYTVTGTLDANGVYSSGVTVNANVAPSSAVKWVIYRDPAITQPAIGVQNDPLPVKAMVELPLDKLTLVEQRLREMSNRSIRQPEGDAADMAAMPNKTDRAGKILSFDLTTGDPVTDDMSLAGIEAALAEAQSALTDAEAAIAQLNSNLVDFAEPTDAYLNNEAGGEPVGYRALVGKAPTGAFAGMRGRVAAKTSNGWLFSVAPKAGQRIFDKASGLFWASQNGWWNKIKPGFTGYQDYADVPDGTFISGLVIATGQTISAQGPGGATGTITGGRYDPPSNTYTVLNQPSKHVKFGMRARWKNTHTTGNGVALAAGVYAGGAIISKMAAHADFEFNAAPTMSVWGGPRQLLIGGVAQGYQIEPDLQYEYVGATDANLPVVAAGQDVIVEVKVSGNTIRSWSENGRFSKSYYDDMVSALLGDDGAGNLGYIYFQSGPNNDANNPYIYEIWWTSLDTPQETLPDPKQIPDPSGLPVIQNNSIAFGSATQIHKYTPVDGGRANMFEIDIVVSSEGVVLGYSNTAQKWRCGGGKFSGTIHASTPAQIGSDHVDALNGSVITLSGTLTQSVSGNDIIISYNPSRTGSDATTYTPNVRSMLYGKGEPIAVV